jgi:hypothetical protein
MTYQGIGEAVEKERVALTRQGRKEGEKEGREDDTHHRCHCTPYSSVSPSPLLPSLPSSLPCTAKRLKQRRSTFGMLWPSLLPLLLLLLLLEGRKRTGWRRMEPRN